MGWRSTAVLAGFVLSLHACLFDWKVGPPGGTPDAGTPLDATTVPEAAAEGSTSGGPPSTGDPCLDAKANFDALKRAAQQCTGTCNGTTPDECGCDVGLANTSSTEAARYRSAIFGSHTSVGTSTCYAVWCSGECPSSPPPLACVNGTCQP